MKCCKLFLILVLAISLQGRIAAQFDRNIKLFTSDTAFRHASVSICFRNAETGVIISSFNEEMSLGSASVMKLVTTAGALEKLGPGFRFSTVMGYAGTVNEADSTLNGYVVIKGTGDPTMLSEYFPAHNSDIIDAWADEIYKTGIRRVTGSVLADATVFDYHPAPGGWNWSDLGNYYGAGAHGIAIFDNMYRIHFKTGDDGAKPEITSIEPEIPGLIIENRLVSHGEVDNGYVYLEPYGDHAVIRGEIPTGRDDFVLKASIPDPPLLAATLLQEALERKGIKFGKKATTLRIASSIYEEYNKSPKVEIYVSLSPDLSEIVSAVNRESLNMHAEQLLKFTGVLYPGIKSTTTESGIEVITEYFKSHLGDTEGLYMTDGSGLSRSNAISSAFLTRLLCFMKNESENGRYFINSLPAAGEEGTLRYYFKDPVFNGRLSAKSGTSTRIRNYAGYIKTISGDEYAFAILVNNFDCTASDVTARVEKLLKEVITGQ